MRVLSLFSGGGLGDYGLELAGMQIVGQVEIDDYCQKILKLRWPDVPKWKDIRDVRGKEVLERCGAVDIVSGGFPCQDISQAKSDPDGIAGDRSGLWAELFRLVCEIRPKYALIENVSALLFRGLGRVLTDLASIGYAAEWETLSSEDFGNFHGRARVWIVAYPDKIGLDGGQGKRNIFAAESFRQEKFINRHRVRSQTIRRFQTDIWLPLEPSIFGMVDESPARMDRLKMLGNGQDVEIVEWIGKQIMEFENTRQERE